MILTMLLTFILFSFVCYFVRKIYSLMVVDSDDEVTTDGEIEIVSVLRKIPPGIHRDQKHIELVALLFKRLIKIKYS